MVLQLGDWQRATANWTKSSESQSVSLSASQSLSPSVSPSVSQCCYVLLQPNKIMWPAFAGGTFRGQRLLQGGQQLLLVALYLGLIRCQSFVLQCPNYFIDLSSTFVQFGVLHTLRSRSWLGAIEVGAEYALDKPTTTLTSLISGMRGEMWHWTMENGEVMK